MLLHEVARLILRHDRRREYIEEPTRALLAAADRLDDRHAERLLELLRIDPDAAALRVVLHIEIDEQRNPLLEELHGEEEIALDVRAVDDVDDEIKLVVQEEIHDDFLLRTARVDAVRPRQIDDRDRAILVARIADLLVDRDARPVADLLPRARQFVKDCRFTGIRIAGECHC